MKKRNVSLIFAREIRDQFRDRRTLFMMLVLPILLYPGLGIGMLQMTVMFTEQSRTVVVLGDEHLPESPGLIDGNQFAPRFFRDDPSSSQLLELVLESSENEEQKTQGDLIRQAHALINLVKRKHELDGWNLSEADKAQTKELSQVEDKLAAKFSGFSADLIIAFPPDFDRFVEDFTTRERPRESQENRNSDDQAWPLVIYNGADEASMLTSRQVAKVLGQFERELWRMRGEKLDLPKSFLSPMYERRVDDHDRHNVEDIAQQEQHSANIWSRFFPTLLILMTLTGAFYPSIDLGAGEKERGTMETLLISPAARSEIVMGKFLTILLFSIMTAMFNIISMGLTAYYMVAMAGESQSMELIDLSLPPLGSFVAMGLMMVPLAAMFSAMSLALATFAKSTKEGQYYLTPLMIVVMGLTVFCMSPGVDLTPFNSVIPVVGIGLLLKSLILAPLSDVDIYVYILPVVLTSIGYSMIALWWAVDQFHREEVLFRESERLDLKLWIKHLLRDKESLPTSSEAIFCFMLIMLLQFLSFGVFQGLLQNPELSPADAILQALTIQQLVIIASPALFMGILLTADVRRTFRLFLARPKWLLMGAVLPALLLPLSITLQSQLQWFFPELPQHIRETLAPMSNPDVNPFKLLAVFALAPALCEELAFRGFVLSGLSRNGRTGVAVVFSALLFGVMHMIPQQVFNAFLLGLVLGLLALRSGSLIPGILFHFVNNAMGVLSERIPEKAFDSGPVSWLAYIKGDQLQFSVITLSICLLGGGACVWHLIQSPNERSPAIDEEVPEAISVTETSLS